MNYFSIASILAVRIHRSNEAFEKLNAERQTAPRDFRFPLAAFQTLRCLKIAFDISSHPCGKGRCGAAQQNSYIEVDVVNSHPCPFGSKRRENVGMGRSGARRMRRSLPVFGRIPRRSSLESGEGLVVCAECERHSAFDRGELRCHRASRAQLVDGSASDAC